MDEGFALFGVVVLRGEEVVAAEVAGHDEDGVFEVDGAALAIGDAAVIEDLEEDVEDVWVGFFDLIKEDDAVGAATDGLGELAAGVVADVAGRSAEEATDAVFFHVFGHVDAGEGGGVVEEELGEGAGEFCFTDAGGAEEDEGSEGAVFVLEAGAGAADGVADGAEGVGLADDVLGEMGFEVGEALEFALLETGDGDASPCGDDVGDVFGGDFLAEEGVGDVGWGGGGLGLVL